MSDDSEQNENSPTIESLAGRTIVSVEHWFDGGGRGEGVTVDLDDGRRISLDAWGHDWWGLNVAVECKACGHDDANHDETGCHAQVFPPGRTGVQHCDCKTPADDVTEGRTRPTP